MSEVYEINNLRTFANHRMLWNSLFAETPGIGFQQSFDWLQQYWRHYGEGKTFRILVVRSAGRTVGILPLCIVRRRHRLGTLRELTYPIDNWGTYYGPIGKNRTATLTVALRYIASTRRDWDSINLGWTSGNANDHVRTGLVLRQVGLAARQELQHQTSIIDFSSFNNWEDYLSVIPKKTRHEFRRHERRVSEYAKVDFIRHRPSARSEGDGDPRWDLYDQCEQIAQKSWQAASTTGNTICDPEHVSFLRDTHLAAARLGMLDMAVLRLDNKPVAFCYGYHHQGRLLGLRMGYASDTCIGGLGNVMLGRVIADSIDRGDQQLDLGPGGEQYKLRIRTKTDEIYRLTHASRTAPIAHVIGAAHSMRQRLTARA